MAHYEQIDRDCDPARISKLAPGVRQQEVATCASAQESKQQRYQDIIAGRNTLAAEASAVAAFKQVGIGAIEAGLGLVTMLAALGAAWYARKAAIHTEAGAIQAANGVAQTKRTAEIAKASLAVDRDTARRQLRAYISISDILTTKIPIRIDESAWKVEIIWTNCGQTPAIHALGWANWRSFPDGLPSDFDFPPPDSIKDGPQPVGPGKGLHNGVIDTISMNLVNAAGVGMVEIVLWGAVNYADIYGRNHRTESALKLRVEPVDDETAGCTWEPIDRHNGVDEGCMHPPIQPKTTKGS